MKVGGDLEARPAVPHVLRVRGQVQPVGKDVCSRPGLGSGDACCPAWGSAWRGLRKLPCRGFASCSRCPEMRCTWTSRDVRGHRAFEKQRERWMPTVSWPLVSVGV